MGGLTYKIGSFNMYKFNMNSTSDINKNRHILTDIIKKFDIVAVQEALSKEAVMSLVQELGPDRWDYRWESPRIMTNILDDWKNSDDDSSALLHKIERFESLRVSGERAKGYSKSKNEAEGYAFIWNKDKFCLGWNETITQGKIVKKTIEPRIINQYRSDPDIGTVSIARCPYYGRFRACSLGIPRDVELRLINTHITYGDQSSAEDRRREFYILANQMYKMVSGGCIDHDNSVKASYTVLLGDYNLNLRRPWTKKPYLDWPKEFEKGDMEFFDIQELQATGNGLAFVPIKTLHTVQESLSSLSSPERDNFDSDRGLANNYDHFTYDVSYEEDKVFTKNGVINAVHEYYTTPDGSDFLNYKKEVSDHLPVYLEMQV